MDSLLASIMAKIDSYRQEAVDFETQLTKIPALSPENGGDGERERAEFMKSWIGQHLRPDELNEYHAPDGRVTCGYRPNLVAMFRGQSNQRTVWIMTHLDVVPPGDLSKWTGDPWTVRVVDGKLIGRGVEDNQQGVTSAVFAMKAYRDLGLTPRNNVGLVFVADEETGSKYGIQYLLKEHRQLFGPDDLILIPDAGDSKGTMIEVAEKSILWLKFHTKGKQAHGSMPEHGRNAHKAASYLAVRLDALYKKFGKRDPMFSPPISTFEPTKREANVPNINTIPGEDVMYFDCRVLPNYKVAEVVKAVKAIAKEVEKKFKVKISISSVQQDQAAPPTPPDAAVVAAIIRAMKELRGRRPRPMGIGGGTVAAYFRRAGIAAAVWSTMDETAHSPDEYCRIDNIVDDAKVFAHIFSQNV
ncbi:MAG: M20 family metallo-hydrolase [candidate division KSB1 bacterium]|nr:M20 family metallo-hydrolase [candidate division KSB1 bacterium]MDZ7303152.1 M20 family metallo-hydrolase [candidate division KSB1 bacterium]MDZ7310132.1 M20 family metallo-hydrolase [candidate division KSB1 bacterium]